MQVDAGVGAQCVKVVVIVRRRGGGNGDIGRGGTSAYHELTRPAHRLDRFVVGGGGADGDHFGHARLALLDFDGRGVKPLGYRPGACCPAHRHAGGYGVQQRPPDGREFCDTHDIDAAEEGRRMFQAGQRRLDEIRRPCHRWRQFIKDRPFEGCDGGKTGMLGRPRIQVNAAPPGLAKGGGRRARYPGQILNAIQLTERRFRNCRLDGLQQRVFVHSLSQSAGQPHRKLLKGHDLRTVTMPARCAETQFPHGYAAMSHYRIAVQILNLPIGMGHTSVSTLVLPCAAVSGRNSPVPQPLPKQPRQFHELVRIPGCETKPQHVVLLRNRNEGDRP